MRVYSYKAYGLSIQSAVLLPELVPGNGRADVLIRLGTVAGLPVEANNAAGHVNVTTEGVYLAWPDVGAFLVRDGCEIIVDPVPNVTAQTLRLFILGTTLAMLLHQRRKTVFHASVIDVGGQAVAFVGAKGAGKSTMAAALQARGHKLLSDDLLVLDPDQAVPWALPGFPQLKLWSDAITSLGYDPEKFPQLRPDLKTEKRGYRLNKDYASEPVPLKCIYILARGSAPKIEPIQPQQALTELMPHWYGARFGPEVLHALGLSTHFFQCVHLANAVEICHLRRPASLSVLPEVARRIEDHVAKEMWPIRIAPIN